MTKSFIPAAHYPALTPYFEELARPFAGRIWKAISREVLKRTEKNATVVDLGCGTGIVLRLHREQRPDLQLLGFDIDHDILHVAKRKAEGMDIRFAKAAIEKIPLSDATADAVLCSLVFHHLDAETKKQTLREVKRILKPGRPFLLCDFSVPTKPWVGKIVSRFSRSEPETISQLRGQLMQLAKEAGASVETLWTMYGCISMHLFVFPSS